MLSEMTSTAEAEHEREGKSSVEWKGHWECSGEMAGTRKGYSGTAMMNPNPNPNPNPHNLNLILRYGDVL